MADHRTLVVGAGFTGLGVGMACDARVLEASATPGGICASYEREGFHFEIGGGHWIFGGDPAVLDLIESAAPCRRYFRKSAVYFAGNLDATRPLATKMAPYPIQNHLHALGEPIARAVLAELRAMSAEADTPPIMDAWLRESFGETLHRLFFGPFHERYTAGLHHEIAPQDPYKSPFRRIDVVKGASGAVKEVGYNVSYLYPEIGLDGLARRIAELVDVEYGARVERVHPSSHTLVLADGRELPYERLISTMPLNRLAQACGLHPDGEPYTSVLVLNLGVELADRDLARHGQHWLYVPDSRTGFHRVGYYSNVDPLFLPARHRDPARFGSLYVEFAFANGAKPSDAEIAELTRRTGEELEDWGFIRRTLIADPTWIDVAYTWRRPQSRWVEDTIRALAASDIHSSGRYGRWNFQGIAESLREGLLIGNAQSLGQALSATSRR
jgi:protoporphyrinogen oxidase